MNADPGFEYANLGIWEVEGDRPITRLTAPSNAFQGNSYVDWRPANINDNYYVQQKVGVLTSGQNGPYRGSVRVRERNLSFDTEAELEVWARTVNFHQSDNGCAYRQTRLDDDDPNHQAAFGTWVIRRETTQVVHGSAYHTLVTPSFYLSRFHDGYDFAIRLKSFSTGGGVSGYVSVDALQMEELR